MEETFTNYRKTWTNTFESYPEPFFNDPYLTQLKRITRTKSQSLFAKDTGSFIWYVHKIFQKTAFTMLDFGKFCVRTKWMIPTSKVFDMILNTPFSILSPLLEKAHYYSQRYPSSSFQQKS